MIQINPVKLFVYVAVLFLLWALYSGGYTQIPKVYKPTYLWLSFMVLFSAFIVEALPWWLLMKPVDQSISLRDSFVSIGISIFGKYIPGKLWSIIGRSAFLSHRYEIPFSDVNTRSIKGQLLVIWSGLIISGIGLALTRISHNWAITVISILLPISILLFTNGINKVWHITGKLLGKRPSSLPYITISQVITLMPFYFLQWFLWCLGFYLFVTALIIQPIPPISGLSFALAAVMGIISFIAPGGLGIREGVLVASLTAFGIDTPDAVSVSVASRLWFLCGECFFFGVAMLLSPRNWEKKNEKSCHPKP